MKAILSPFRQQDGAEVVTIIKKMGGLEKVHFAFYDDEYERLEDEREAAVELLAARARVSSGTSASCRTCTRL